ncbi:YcxB family protein [Dyadobacter luticola]|uniref:YcxB family protein n=1 Tax=Dyadobacter luticola TaxID=1979387 RepID=A0A5R9L147_9BACT|nr:YcxB family protein [Dyadobacter luticola]TLV02141.1 YcxB family protein [Dyadobacter luticola]
MNEIPFQLTAEELYRGLIALARTRLITKMFRILGMVLLAVLVFITVVMIKDGNFQFTSGYVVTLLLAVYGYFLPEISARIQAPSMVKSQNPIVQPMKLSVHKTYYVLTGENFTNRLTYEKMHSAVETEEFFLLKTSEGSGQMIPKRIFTPEQIAQLKAILLDVNGLKVKFL